MEDNYSLYVLFLSEFTGTMLLLLLGVGVSANTSLRKSFGYGSDWLLIAFGWGFAVFVGASVAFRSGSQLNPAVTVSLAFLDSFSWSLVPMFIAAQILGAMAGAGLAYLVYKKQFDTHDDPANTGGIFYTSPSVRAPVWNVLSEAVGTFVLITWVIQSSPFEPGTGDTGPTFGNSALGYAGVAFTVIAIGASLGGPTGYAINPARDLGPRIMYSLLPIKGKGSSNWGYAWVPLFGPMVGMVAALAWDWIGGGGPGALN